MVRTTSSLNPIARNPKGPNLSPKLQFSGSVVTTLEKGLLTVGAGPRVRLDSMRGFRV